MNKERNNLPFETPAGLTEECGSSFATPLPNQLSGNPAMIYQPKDFDEAITMLRALEIQRLALEKENDELRQAKQEAETNVSNYRSIFENMEDAFYEATLDGTMLEISSSIEIISRGEYNRADLIGRSLVDFYHLPEDREAFYSELFKKGSVTDYDLSLRNRDGTIVDVSISSRLIPERDGNPGKIIGSIRDITHRKQAEAHVIKLLHNESVLSRISDRTLYSSNLDEFIDFSLAELGVSLQVSRVYLFEYFYTSETMDNTYEWCAPGIEPQIDELKGIPLEMLPWWIETLSSNQIICYSDIEEIPDEMSKEILRPQGILSILVVPLQVKNRFWGFIGFDDCLQHRQWPKEDVDILNSISHLISGFIERKQGEEALKESLSQLNIVNQNLEERVVGRTKEILRLSNLQQAILDNAGLAIISTDSNGIIQTFNAAAQRMLGYSAEEIVGKVTPELFHDPDELIVKALEIQSLGSGPIPHDFEVFTSMLQMTHTDISEWKYIRKDHTSFPVKLTISSIVEDNGNITGYIGVAMDISYEKQFIETLRESEERFHKMFHDHSALMLLVNPDTGEIVDANRAAREFYGYDFNQYPKIDIFNINNLSKEQIELEMAKAINQHRNYFEFYHKRASGEVRLVEVHSTPIEVGGARLLFSVIHDITERREMEEVLINSEKTLNQITDGVPILIALANRNLEYTFTNSTYENFFQREKSEFIGKKISEILPSETFEKAYPFLLKALKGETNTFENRIKNNKGEERIIQTTYLPYFQNNVISGILATVIDITARVQSEEMLRRSEAENRGILSAIPDLMFRLSREGIFLGSHSDNQESLYVAESLFLGKTIEEVLPAEVGLIAANALKEAFLTNEIMTIEYELPVQGEVHYYENRILAISDEEALSIVRDISQRKIAEKALLWNEAFLKKMTESSPLAFLVVDNRTDDILYINHQFCEIWGINHLEEEIRKGKLKNNDIIPDCLPVLKDIPAFAESCKPLQDEHNRVVVEDEIPFVNGRTVRRFSTQIRDTADYYHGRLYIFEEITERKNNEKLILLQRDLATKLNATSNLREALSQTLDSILLFQNIDAGGIYLLNTVDNELNLVLHKGLSDQFIREKSFFPSDSPQVKKVLEGKPIFGVYKEEIFSNINTDLKEHILSLAVIPIKHEGKVIGALNLASKTAANFYVNIQLSLESLAFQLGGTISRINAENSLLASQENFRILFDTINDFMFILDIEGIIIRTNTVVEKRLGYSLEELQKMHVLELHPPDRRNEAGQIVEDMLAGKKSFCPVPLYAKDGTQIPVETHVILGKWDGVDVLFGISRDVTERQLAETALRESESRWNFALEGSGDGVWDWNAVTNEVFYSRQWKAMLGYTEKEIGNSLNEWDSRIHPEDKEDCYAELQKHFKGETEIYSNEHRIRCKDGSYKWILDRGKVVAWMPDGQPLRVIGTHSDVSARKEFEESLRSAISKEKELNDLKSRFVSMASHEFRTPLASILMMSDSLLAYWKRMEDQQIEMKLKNIKDQVQHLAKVVTDVMQVAKIQEGKLSYDPDKVDFVEICHEVIRDFNSDHLLAQKIQFDCNFDVLYMVLDSRLIKQVLNNLISNAIKYSQPDPEVRVKLFEEGNEILLSVGDNGIGIPKEDQGNIFKPFYRAGNTKQIQGNGLGLNIVRESVQLHNGEITFESLSGEGSIFSVHLSKSLIVSNINNNFSID